MLANAEHTSHSSLAKRPRSRSSEPKHASTRRIRRVKALFEASSHFAVVMDDMHTCGDAMARSPCAWYEWM